MIEAVGRNARVRYFRDIRLHVKSLVVKSPGTYPIQFRHDPILFRKLLACLVIDVTEYDKCFPSKWVNCIRYNIYFYPLANYYVENKRKSIGVMSENNMTMRNENIDLVERSSVFSCVTLQRQIIVRYHSRSSKTEEWFNGDQKKRALWRPLMNERDCSKPCNASHDYGHAVWEDARVRPNTRHKRNYYYARYSHIPFKAFGRTFGGSDCRRGYYPIELIRSSPRAMSYEPSSYDILYLLTNGTRCNKKRLARREPR